MRLWSVLCTLLVWAASWARAGAAEDEGPQASQRLWAMAQEKAQVHRFSTLFAAQDVRERLGADEGLDQAVQWCRATAVTKVYVETFRDGYQADTETLVRARDRFRREGFIVHGCVTTTGVGRRSTGWDVISCYTDLSTQERLEQIFRLAARLFDVVMIDDFWFTDCECEQCQKARGEQTWAQYRCALMERVSGERIVGPAREVNRRVRIIIKYPEWYDLFHQRGYDVVRQSELFDITWIGTETRDPDSSRWGRKPQYGAYWIARWAEAFSRGRLGGGWYDPFGTSPNTYVEQARQTILGGVTESMLFCYGALHRGSAMADVEALRRELPQLFDLAQFIAGERVRGVGTYKPPNSSPGEDSYIFNFLGMLGIPTTADVQFPGEAPSLLLTCHALADPGLERALERAMDQRKPILITSGFRAGLSANMRERLAAPTVRALELKGKETKKSAYGVLDSVRDLMNLPREEADALRRPLLQPLGVDLSAPPRVALYLYGERKVVVENFNDQAAEVELTVRGAKGYRRALVLPPDADIRVEPGGRGQEARATATGATTKLTLPARSLVALTVQ